MSLKYKRVILKISGEALAGEKGFGIDNNVLNDIASQIIEAERMGAEIGIVVGGGNFWRGRLGVGMDRTTADHMGMLATVMNALAMQDALENMGAHTRVMTAIDMQKIAEPYIMRRAIRHMEKQRIVVFACGTGNPFFTTDTAAALRAADVDAEIMLLAKNVDGVYDSDPKVNPDAKMFDKIGYLDVVNKGLQVMDNTACTLCMENNIPILAFGITQKDGSNAIKRALLGESIGTLIS